MKFRGDVAICGQLGYELNLALLSDSDKAEVREQIKTYHQLADVFHNGDLYRLITPENSDVVANEFISEDKNTVIVCLYVMRARPNNAFKYAKLKGLDLNALYVDQKGKEYTGDYLTHFGFKHSPDKDYDSKIIVLNKK
jgi:alpha-galactosidase